MTDTRSLPFEFGDTHASQAFMERNPAFGGAFSRLIDLTNRSFGRAWRFSNRAEDVCYHLAQRCRLDFLDIALLAVNGRAAASQALLRSLYERGVTLEYIRRNPEKAEKFVRYAAIQEFKAAKKALEIHSREEFDKAMATAGFSFNELKGLHEQIKPEFPGPKCKHCGKGTGTAISWDLDMASIVNSIGGPLKDLYLMCYTVSTLHIHATLASAFAHGDTGGEPTSQDAERALIFATLTYVLSLQSLNEMFGLGLDDEVRMRWEEVTTIWRPTPPATPTN
jgi:hypothetical protein